MRRGVFGGSFDPVHEGHVIVATAAADRLALDRVHFVPAREQPFKQGRHAATPEDRVAMLRLALEGDARFVLDTREIARGGPSYTVDTLRSLKAEFPGDPLFFLVGADAAREMPQWHEATRLPELAEIVMLARPGARSSSVGLVSRTLDVPQVEVSATDIRRRVADGLPIQGLVPAKVADYIAAHDLYRRD